MTTAFQTKPETIIKEFEVIDKFEIIIKKVKEGLLFPITIGASKYMVKVYKKTTSGDTMEFSGEMKDITDLDKMSTSDKLPHIKIFKATIVKNAPTNQIEVDAHYF